MRALVLVSLFACLVSAEDNPVLAKAVEQFKSRDPAQREAASRSAIDEARKALAPLIRAMEDPDPEVRRRAREAILSLVPRKAHEPKETAIHRADGILAMPGFNVRARVLQKWFGEQKAAEKARKRARLLEQAAQLRLALVLQKHALAQDLEKKEKDIRAKLGLRGDLVVSVVNQRGRRMELSFRVASISKESPAARLGVRTGDIIREVNGRILSGQHPFHTILGDKPEIKKLKVIRGAEILELAMRRR